MSMSFNQGFTPGSGRPQSAGINTTGFDVNPLTGETIQANSGTQQLFWQGQQAETLDHWNVGAQPSSYGTRIHMGCGMGQHSPHGSIRRQ